MMPGSNGQLLECSSPKVKTGYPCDAPLRRKEEITRLVHEGDLSFTPEFQPQEFQPISWQLCSCCGDYRRRGLECRALLIGCGAATARFGSGATEGAPAAGKAGIASSWLVKL